MRRRDARGYQTQIGTKYTASSNSLSPESIVRSTPTSCRGIYADSHRIEVTPTFLCSYPVYEQDETQHAASKHQSSIMHCSSKISHQSRISPKDPKNSCKGAPFLFFLFNMLLPQLLSRILDDSPLLCRLKQLPLAGDVVGRKPRDNAVCNLLEPFSCQRQDSWTCT